MAKKYVITFSISVLVLVSVCLIMLMLMVPQKQESLTGSIPKYEQLNKNDYKYEKTKDISKESLVREYIVSDSDIITFKKYSQYKPGNSDPFTPKSDENNTPNNPEDETTNGNGGIPNPPSSGK